MTESSASRSTLVSVATYNEIDNLPRLVDEILQHVPQADVLVVDDNSPDGTGKWCDRRMAEEDRLRCLHRPGKQGQGSAVLAAMRYAIEHDYRYLVNMDADFSHPPHNLPDLLKLLEGVGEQSAVDVAIGSRYVPGGGTRNWPWTRRFMSRCVNIYTRWLLGLRPRDCSGAFRCYRVELLKRIKLDGILSKGYAFHEEILWRLRRQGARLAETPILFTDRRMGQSKIDAGEAFSALWIIFKLGLYHWFCDWRKPAARATTTQTKEKKSEGAGT